MAYIEEQQPNGYERFLATAEWMSGDINCTKIINLQFPAQNMGT
jgi:hypothetical protein